MELLQDNLVCVSGGNRSSQSVPHSSKPNGGIPKYRNDRNNGSLVEIMKGMWVSSCAHALDTGGRFTVGIWVLTKETGRTGVKSYNVKGERGVDATYNSPEAACEYVASQRGD